MCCVSSSSRKQGGAVAIACGCNSGKQFVWTDGSQTITYKNEVEARAQVIRKGGSYQVVAKK